MLLLIKMMKSKFFEIIKEQTEYRHVFIKDIRPPNGGICIQIKNNMVSNVYKGNGWIHPKRTIQYVTLIKNMLEKYQLNDCNVNINLGDHPMPGYLNFCRKQGDNKSFLIPTFRFTLDDIVTNNDGTTMNNYDDIKKHIHNFNMNNHNKINKFYTSSIPHQSKKTFLMYAANNPDICHVNAYIGTVHGKVALEPKDCLTLSKVNMLNSDFIPFTEHCKYKYVIYNDGNTLSDRMRLLLLTDSVIIKQKTPYEEFFWYMLKNEQNYIEYRDINDIRTIHEYLENNHELCNKIIQNNADFVNEYLTYDEILLYTYELLKSLID